ncbi:MAG: hypothetical protein Fur0039_01330 [Rhodocyclaceae bacterium]
MIDILFHVSTPGAARILLPLAQACARARVGFACFFTHDGVRVLEDAALRAALRAAGRAVACGESWKRFGGAEACPVELGSQTDDSALMGEAARVVSL